MNYSAWENRLGGWLQEPVREVKSYLNKGDVFVDVGANTGLFTQMILNDPVIELSKVVMFEPVPMYYEECKRKFSSFDNIFISNLALSDVEEEVNIVLDSHNLGVNVIHPRNENAINNKNVFGIKCITFDTWFRENSFIDRVDFFKVDAEKYDLKVIRGMFGTINHMDKKPHIFFEKCIGEEQFIVEMKEVFGYDVKYYKDDRLLIGKREV